MNLILLGMASALDVMANAFVFSGMLRTDFDVVEAAQFSAVLGWAAMLSALMFGGAEQVLDHTKRLPSNGLGSPRTSVWLSTSLCGAILVGDAIEEVSLHIAAVLLLAPILGMRGLGRAAAYAKRQYRSEVAISAVELFVLVGVTAAGGALFSSYVFSKLLGVGLRIRPLASSAESRVESSHMWSYSFAAIAPAIYFNVYYTALPMLAPPETIVRFRLLQTILVPMSFLGSLLARARIVFHGGPSELVRILDGPALGQTPLDFSAAALLPAALAAVYIGIIGHLFMAMSPAEMAWAVAYCTLIYHRAQLYSHITLNLGPVARARVAVTGVLLVVLSLIPVAASADPGVGLLFALLSAVEAVLLVLSAVVLSRRRAESES